MQLNRQSVPGLPCHPETVIQFGEGNFLRAFVDWIIQRMNEQLDFNASVAVVQPIPQGASELLNAQDGLYHVILEGIHNGNPIREIQRIDCVSRCINPYNDFAAYEQLVVSPDLRFLVSNTTEAGIRWTEGEALEMRPPISFPGKVTALLYRRFEAFDGASDKGLILFCCELIEDNGQQLKDLVIRYGRNWNLPEPFFDWLEQHCAFCSTLVDRIVPGFPRESIDAIHAELGFEDQLVVVGEHYHSWVVNAPAWVGEEFPADQLGLNIRFVDAERLRQIRDQKVRLLNGCHTGMMPIAFLAGIDTVRETVTHDTLGSFMRAMCMEEIVPQTPGDPELVEAYAEQILERFHNPFIRHEWRSISLNSMSKWETRVLPTLLDTVERTGKLPSRLAFSLAALIAFYRGRRPLGSFECIDKDEVLSLFQGLWRNPADSSVNSSDDLRELVSEVLGYAHNWKRDLNQIPGLTDAVTGYLADILECGTLETARKIDP